MIFLFIKKKEAQVLWQKILTFAVYKKINKKKKIENSKFLQNKN